MKEPLPQILEVSVIDEAKLDEKVLNAQLETDSFSFFHKDRNISEEVSIFRGVWSFSKISMITK